MGFYDPQLPALVPWYANIATRRRVAVDNGGHMVCRRGRYFESGFQLAAYRINAFDAELADTRRAIGAGALMCSFFAFCL